MKRAGRRWTVLHLVAAAIAAPLLTGRSSLATAQIPPPRSTPQNPSPMTEATRAHERLATRTLAGTVRSFVGPAGRPVELLVSDRARANKSDSINLVVHFHGAAWLAQQAVDGLGDDRVTAVVNLGAGSGGYDRAFADPAAFDSLVAGVAREVSAATGTSARVAHVTLVGFSAGHGAVRAILREPRHFAAVDAVLLLDGLHTSYVPEGTVVAAGGTLDTTNLVAFADFARAAIRGEKRFLVTHSEIFPGTFASTTETADWLLGALGLRRTPVLRSGPRGMQQLSEVRAGRFELLGFAGNAGPDHTDHLHAMPEFLARTLTAGTASAPGTKPTTSFTGDLGYVSATGNTKLTTLSIGEKIGRTDGRWTLTQLAAYVYGQTDAKESANQLRVAGRADFAFQPRLGLFGGVAFERNSYAGFDSRVDEIAGAKWKAILAPSDSMNVDAGGVLTQQANVDGTSQSYPSARFAAAYKHQFSRAAYFQQLAEYVPNLQTSGAYRVNTESAIVAPISAHVGIKLNYAVRYDSRPPVKFGTTDRVLTMGVQLSY